jgi:hypothetical protein
LNGHDKSAVIPPAAGLERGCLYRDGVLA